MKTHNKYGLAFLTSVSLLAACSKDDKLTCGDGTTEKGGECVATGGDGDEGLGGFGGDGTVDPRFEGVPASRLEDAQTVADEFEGAQAAGPASSTSAIVSWDLTSVEDVTFNIYVSTEDGNFPYGKPFATAGAGVSSILLVGLEKNSEHFIVVRAVVAGVEISGSDTPVSVTLSADSNAPSFVGIDEIETVDGAAVRVSWKPAKDDKSPEGVLSYLVYLGTESGEVDLFSPVAVSDAGTRSVVVHLPAPDTEYFFIVRARDAAGNIDDNEIEVSGTSGPDVEKPVFSGCEAAVARNASSLDVFWTPASDDVATEDTMIYNIYASTEPDGQNFSQPSATVVGGERGVVKDLEADETYYVVCRAQDPSGNESDSIRTQFATTKDDDQPPVFAGLSGIANEAAESVELVWNAATDNQTLPEDIIYRVYLSDTIDGHDFENDAPFAESAPGALSIILEDLTSRTEYFVVVVAVDDSLNKSTPTPAEKVTTLVSLLKDIEIPIFSSNCATANCHSGEIPATGLNLSLGFSYLNLVDVTAQTDNGVTRVVPFQPDISMLNLRVESTDEIFRMPKNTGLPLSADDIATIRQWVAEGAQNN